jgi:hypothetical protein
MARAKGAQAVERGGNSYDQLDNHGRPSAVRVVRNFRASRSERSLRLPGQRDGFKVVAFAPMRCSIGSSATAAIVAIVVVCRSDRCGSAECRRFAQCAPAKEMAAPVRALRDSEGVRTSGVGACEVSLPAIDFLECAADVINRGCEILLQRVAVSTLGQALLDLLDDTLTEMLQDLNRACRDRCRREVGHGSQDVHELAH